MKKRIRIILGFPKSLRNKNLQVDFAVQNQTLASCFLRPNLFMETRK